ncbi:MAG: bifunctional diaminohydroxyphosphoribosylaminopyrimidine deaminase/5-amino-6-(5-phosphoribosylamino)uracil reductase RibD [Acidimicrobiia bacterium]
MGDDLAMQRAIDLAQQARRVAPPNPWVGCVLVRDGAIVGEGDTAAPGGPHAEIVALRAAGERARNATAYVTLEPCAHHGRTGPCADALVEAGVARVVLGLEDPDPQVAGRGVERLRAAGVDVEVGVGAGAVHRQLEPYLHHRRTGRPYVVGKLAQSLDGRVLVGDGSPRWLTGAAARAGGHELRADSQAIVVGSGTALADHPALTVRDVVAPPLAPPLRVLLDRRGRVAARGPLFDPSLAPTLVVTSESAGAAAVDGWLAAGAKVERAESLDGALEVMGRFGVLQALVEGGPTLLDAFAEAGRLDRLTLYVAPVVLGAAGRRGLSCASEWRMVATRGIGADVRIDCEPAGEG